VHQNTESFFLRLFLLLLQSKVDSRYILKTDVLLTIVQKSCKIIRLYRYDYDIKYLRQLQGSVGRKIHIKICEIVGQVT
jgi:hypothetical protein